MIKKIIKISDNVNKYRVCIGKRGEYNTLKVLLDVSGITEAIGECRVEIVHKPPGANNYYVVSTSTDGNYVAWTIKLPDTNNHGEGSAIVRFYTSDGLAKSREIVTNVLESNDAVTGSMPNVVQEWLNSFESYCDTKIKQYVDEKGIDEEAIAEAVSDYLEEHPVPTLTESQVRTLITGYGYLTSTLAATLYQPKGNYLTEHQDISGKANVGDSYTKSESDAKYLTEHQSLSAYLTKVLADSLYQSKGNYLTEHQDISGKANVGDSYTKEESDGKYITEHQSLSDYVKKTEIPTALKNPYAITINGTSYDGSEAKEITVQGGSGGTGNVSVTLDDDGNIKISGNGTESMDSHINDLIDAKITPLETLADNILGVM